MKRRILLGILLAVLIKTEGRVEKKSSLTFVIDNTGSMGDDIEEVKSSANAIFDTVMRSDASQIEDFILVTFNDPGVLLRKITKDRDSFKRALNGISVYGGGDCPELSMEGIEVALEKSRDASLVYVFTDASAKDYDKFSKVEALSQKKQSQVVFVLTGECGSRTNADYQVYHKLADSTSGQVFHVRKTEVGKILKYVETTVESRKNVIASKSYPAGYGNSFDVVVDGNTKELVIAVSGRKPKVKVTDSVGTEMPTEDVTRLNEVAVVKVVNVKPDVYKVEVGSETDTRVTVSGTTSVHFQHGFSVLKPTSITDTATRPVPGEKSHLSIKLSTEGDVIVLISVEILDMDDHVILQAPLKLVDKKEEFYTTEPVEIPNHMFKIAIKGYDAKSNTYLTRISLTPIKPQDPTTIGPTPEKAPVISIDEDEIDAEYDEPLQVSCKVSGYPKPDITWEADAPVGETSQEDSTIELPSNFVSVLNIKKVNKNATFICKAVNKLGASVKSIAVKTAKKTYFKVLELPKDTTIEYGKEGEIRCKVDAIPPAIITWYKKNRPLVTDENLRLSDDNSTLYIKSMDPSIENKYVCEAKNELERKVAIFEVTISGLEKPELDKTTKTISTLRRERVNIRCNVNKAKPEPTFTWYYKQEISSSFTELDETSNNLQLEDVEFNDSGIYRCVAKNAVGNDDHDVELIVQYPPVVTKSVRPSVLKKQGETVTLECPVDGRPVPELVWTFNGARISSRHRFFGDGGIRFIATLDDAGDYECTARNKHGVTSVRTKLDVFNKPEIDKTINTVTTMSHGSVDIRCNVPKVKPKPTFTWYYKKLISPSFTELVESSDILHLEDVESEESGIYRCVVANAVGNDYHDVELVVQYPPIVTKGVRPSVVKRQGETVTLECPVDGRPAPDVVWNFNGAEINSRHRLFRDGSIRFTATLNDKGYYECKASNKLGVASVRTKLDVILPTSIDPPEKGTLEVLVGSQTSLPCRAHGSPKPALFWIFYSKNPKIPPKKLLPSDSSGSLILPRIQQDQDGFYSCVASNAGASNNITYEVVVIAPPFIMNSAREFTAVVDDKVLRVPCQAFGNPKPEIRWKRDGFIIPAPSEWFDIADDGSLLIKNVDMLSTGNYVCQAQNKFAVKEQAYEVKVESSPQPGFLSKTLTLKAGSPASVPCSVPHDRTDQLRWFTNGRMIAKGELQFTAVTQNDAGLYICRVSSFMGAKTGTTQIKVRSEPRFIYGSVEDNLIEFSDGDLALMDCSIEDELGFEVQWYHNGVRMDYNELVYETKMDSPSVTGRYKCIVSNEFGTAEQEFEIQNSDCILDIKTDFNGNAPLMLTPRLELPKFKVTNGQISIPKEEKILLYCPTGFTVVPRRSVTVTCKENKKFSYMDTEKLYTDFKCRFKVEVQPKRTKVSCGAEFSELIDIGFAVGNKFIKVYQLCVDVKEFKTHYSKLDLQPNLANALPNYGFNNVSLGDLDTIFDCDYQNNEISAILGLDFHRRDGCCFAKRQLVSPKDVAPGVPQRATFHSVNIVPHWSTCNSQNWDDVEQRIRNLAESANHELQVWTGVAQDLQMLDVYYTPRNITLPIRMKEQSVPTFLWKVVQDPASKASLAIIQVNVPDLTLKEVRHYVRCRDVCDDVSWMNSRLWMNVNRGFTYCCELSEFERAFRYFRTFQPYYRLLKDAPNVSDHYLH